MQFRKLAVVAVALLVVLSGCSAFGGSQPDASNESTADDTENGADADGGTGDNGTENTTDTTHSNGSADTGSETGDNSGDTADDGNEADDDEDETATEDWSAPQEPNRPLEDKSEDRIESVEFVDTEPAADGEGYSNFNLEVVANTSMENVDPPEHGDVIGEPYFFVKINEGPGERKLIERTGQVQMEDNGTYHIDVRPAGIEEFADRDLSLEVFLMDEDKDWDDIYDAVGTSIQFNPETETETEGETETTTDSASNDQ
ncbi:hypothetical protein [Natrialba sp. PRR66]|uniref:hypothetical protein n=1 Tax=Natrialba sp. PRR66 TaxID=3098146 RepID=UPI002B1E55F8|nr:hypothetical protein [Natrialba sp. PRR66]